MKTIGGKNVTRVGLNELKCSAATSSTQAPSNALHPPAYGVKHLN